MMNLKHKNSVAGNWDMPKEAVKCFLQVKGEYGTLWYFERDQIHVTFIVTFIIIYVIIILFLLVIVNFLLELIGQLTIIIGLCV